MQPFIDRRMPMPELLRWANVGCSSLILPLVLVVALHAIAALNQLQAQSYQERLAETDTNNPDELYQLAMWCRDNQRHMMAKRHLRAATKIDPEYAPAWEALGFVYYNNRWTHKSRVPKSVLGEAADSEKAAPGGEIRASGPGPTMDQVDWQAEPIQVPESPHNGWVKKIILEFNSVRLADAWSTEPIDNRVATLLLEEHLPLAIPTMTQLFASGELQDRHGAAAFAQALLRKGSKHRPAIQPLIPYLAKGLENHREVMDQQQVVILLGKYGERKAVPLLVHLMTHPDEDLQFYAKSSLSQITKIAANEIDANKAQKWWDRYHQATDQQIYASMLSSRDESLRMGAAEALYHYQDKRILPVLAKLASSDNRGMRIRVGSLVKKITGNDFSITDSKGEEGIAKAAELFDNWVKESSRNFTWVEFRDAKPSAAQAPAQQQDVIGSWLADLGGLDPTKSGAAYNNLRAKGNEVLPRLITALGTGDPIGQNKVRDLLREMSGQNFGFDAITGTKAGQDDAIAKWQAWLAAQQ